MDYAKYNRRALSLSWAFEHLSRMVETGSFRRASRAASHVYALDLWLQDNPPLLVTPSR